MKRRKALWLRVRAGLSEQHVPGSLRMFFEKVLVLALQHLNEDEVKVFVGFGGIKGGRVDRAYRERLREAGRKPKPGLAELSGYSRSSMIRARRLAVSWGVLMVAPGGGTRPDGTGIGGRGLANDYRLDGLPRPPAPLPAPEPARPQGLERLGDIAARLPDPRLRGP